MGPETPPPLPLPPGPGDRGQTGLKDVIKAAVLRTPSRPTDQVLYWTITTVVKATKELGFPVVVTFLLTAGFASFGNRFIAMQERAIAAQQSLLEQNNRAALLAQDRSTEAIREMAASQAESAEITRALMVEVGLRPPPKRKRPPP